MRDTEKTEKDVRATRCSVFTLPSRARRSLMSAREICVKKTFVALQESSAITLSTNCDLSIECLGVRAIECLGVHVATIVVRMMKMKVATSRFSNF